MNPQTSPAALAGLSGATPSFRVRQSPEAPDCHQLQLEDAHGNVAQWIIPVALKQLARQPVLLWLLPASAPAEASDWLETGSVKLTPSQASPVPDLRTLLMQGLLQLNFGGQLLRGYHRLRCLEGGNGQLWQLTPISHA